MPSTATDVSDCDTHGCFATACLPLLERIWSSTTTLRQTEESCSESRIHARSDFGDAQQSSRRLRRVPRQPPRARALNEKIGGDSANDDSIILRLQQPIQEGGSVKEFTHCFVTTRSLRRRQQVGNLFPRLPRTPPRASETRNTWSHAEHVGKIPHGTPGRTNTTGIFWASEVSSPRTFSREHPSTILASPPPPIFPFGSTISF